jgi:2-oxoglutarate dehydrogenase E2 component (dihydrolipoamide succinyltransferase)
VDGSDIIYNYFYDIGVAISIDRGLIVPVLRDADRLHFADIETAISDLANRAQEKKLLPDELTGGTFTITNGGVFGSLLSTPIPAYPQSAILGMHAIKKRPVVIDDQITVRSMMYVALTYDHRIIDGREAVGFLARIKEYIEDPDKLLLEL